MFKSSLLEHASIGSSRSGCWKGVASAFTRCFHMLARFCVPCKRYSALGRNSFADLGLGQQRYICLPIGNHHLTCYDSSRKLYYSIAYCNLFVQCSFYISSIGMMLDIIAVDNRIQLYVDNSVSSFSKNVEATMVYK